MLRIGNTIRLNQKEKDRLTLLTGAVPVGIASVETLNQFVESNQSLHHNGTLEGRLIASLLDDERIQD